jgi:Flp pilus assembly protein TadD
MAIVAVTALVGIGALGAVAARPFARRHDAPPADVAAPNSTNDAQAAFEAGVAAQKLGRFHDAREAYLRALALDPAQVDARYNLAVLTHGVGADDEARHHLQELESVAPQDRRIAGLRAALERR